MSKSNAWDDPKKAAQLTQELSNQEKILKQWDSISSSVQAMSELTETITEEEIQVISEDLEEIDRQIEKIELEIALNSEQDQLGAILTIHPGAGGTESCDWAGILYRMYSRWLEKNQWNHKLIDYQPGDEAGIKDVTIEVDHHMAYGYLKGESGVHRLVRISPFDANHRRHTSFASVFIYPLVDDEIDIEIQEKDLKIDFYRSSGPGGQNVNKVSTAVRITHLPSKIVVQSQSERSQVQNRNNAMKVLKARLYQKRLDEEATKKDALEKSKTEIAWGHQIRSYVFAPYTQVKDHRTGMETGNVNKIIDGDIDEFIRAYILWSGGKNQ